MQSIAAISKSPGARLSAEGLYLRQPGAQQPAPCGSLGRRDGASTLTGIQPYSPDKNGDQTGAHKRVVYRFMDPNQSAEAPLTLPGPPGELRAWRKQLRLRLLRVRAALSSSVRASASRRIYDQLSGAFPQIWTQTVGLYWPMLGEAELSEVIGRIRSEGGRTALPAVASKHDPLEFVLWNKDAILTCDVCGIPCPMPGASVQPDVLLVPVLGFDRACYRLGYGGGYYDRTLATFSPKPLTIGIGYELGRVETIFPQPFDIPLGFIVTEESIYTQPEGTRPTANHSCQMIK